MDTPERTPQQILSDNSLLALGTNGSMGPWVAYIAYTIVDRHLYTISHNWSRHAKDIEESGRIAGAILDRTGEDLMDCIQFSATAELAHDESSIRAVLSAGGKTPTDEHVRSILTHPDKRLYRFTITEAYTQDWAAYNRDETDTRKQIDIADLFA